MTRKFITQGLRLATLAIAILGTTACAGSPGSDQISPTESEEREMVVDVESRHWNPVKVFVRVGAARHRLGEVEPYSKTRFSIPRGVAGPIVQIELRPFGSLERFTTQPVQAGASGLSLIVSSDVRKSVLVSW